MLEVFITGRVYFVDVELMLLGLTDIGNIPYSLARPFLIKVESPKQLVSLGTYNDDEKGFNLTNDRENSKKTHRT